MLSKTPKFDRALDAILKDLKPHARQCKKCGQNFEIFKEDIDFYHKLRVPPPTLCPECRKQRRLAFSNNTIFYKRKCDAPGHAEEFISLYSPRLNWKVYDNNFWWSDKWEPMSFGQNYDLSMPFFNQFQEFYKNFPLIQTNRDPKSIGSEYTAYGLELKDCYYVFGGIKAENVIYGNWPMYSRDCMDVLMAYKSELCYEVVSAINNYNCNFIYFSDNCLDSDFLYDCKNCTHSFGCTNLRNKQYYFFNQPLTKEEYERKIKDANLGSLKELEVWQNKFADMLKSEIKRAARTEKIMNSVGTFLRECKNCFMCFWVEKGENLRYIDYALDLKDSMDASVTGATARNELTYESNNIGTYDIKFSNLIRAGNFLEYCISCFNCGNCFGCVGLRNKK
ncbi:MAG: hypothetical protein Q8Q97_00310, partial [bacterium]|nr:hypothetical protein [bacterium]